MSGTSTDGISAALVRLRPTARGYEHRLLAFRTYRYAERLRAALLRCAEGTPQPVAELSRLNVALGEELARAAARIAAEGGVPLAAVDCIGSHGHTVFHGPPRRRGPGRPTPVARRGHAGGSTLQIGEPAVIAVRTGVTVIADFRPADVAARGEGAPLAPYVHWLLFTDTRFGRAIQNVGGIGNVTYLPPRAGADDVLAFDTGPGNMVIDALVARFSAGRARFDRGGRMAAAGTADPRLLSKLLRHPYLRRQPPKSTGREEFGAAMVSDLVRDAQRLGLSAEDTVATATVFTAASIADAYRRFVKPRGRLDAVHVAGGGALNRTLLGCLGDLLPGVHVGTVDELGVGSETMEAIAFAVLACETLRGRCGNLPSVTGAERRVVLGKIVPGSPEQWRRLTRRVR
jgi:anhydro-N-acetylmuramic acid kinase